MKYFLTKMLNSMEPFKLRNPLKSVGMKLFVVFFLSIFIFVSVVGVVSYTISKSLIQDKVAKSTLQTIDITNQKIDSVLANYSNLTLQFNEDAQISNDIYEYYYDDKLSANERAKIHTQLYNKLILIANAMGGYSNISLIPLNGKKPLSTDKMKANTDFTKQPWFNETVKANGKGTWLKSTKSGYVDTTNHAIFGFTRLLKNMNKLQNTTVLVLELDTNTLTGNLSKIKLGDTGKLMMVDQHNSIVDAKDNKLIGQSFPITVPKGKNSKGDYFTIKQNGVQQLVVYKTSSFTGWTTYGVVKTAELVKETNKILKFSIWMTIIAAILAIVIGMWMARMIGKPLGILRNLMIQGAGGNLSVRVQVKSKDEIGQLGSTFNEMMGQITDLVGQTKHSAEEVLQTANTLMEASKKTVIAAKETSQATEQIAEGASSLAADAEHGNELTLQITKKMQEIINHNEEMGQSSQEVKQSSETGKERMMTLVEDTNQTEKMTRSMVEKVNELKESTNSIQKILDVLSNITNRTNILSLNATIEASRAGEAGKGFMVVAHEIRSLADQSKQSINVVGEITEKVQGEIEETVDIMTEAYPLFQKQITSVKDSEGIFLNVEEYMQEFIQNIGSVTDSISQLNESQKVLAEAMSSVSAVAEQSSATSEEVASLSSDQLAVSDELVRLSEQLANLSNKLKDSLMKFNV